MSLIILCENNTKKSVNTMYNSLFQLESLSRQEYYELLVKYAHKSPEIFCQGETSHIKKHYQEQDVDKNTLQILVDRCMTENVKGASMIQHAADDDICSTNKELLNDIIFNVLMKNADKVVDWFLRGQPKLELKERDYGAQTGIGFVKTLTDDHKIKLQKKSTSACVMILKRDNPHDKQKTSLIGFYVDTVYPDVLEKDPTLVQDITDKKELHKLIVNTKQKTITRYFTNNFKCSFPTLSVKNVKNIDYAHSSNSKIYCQYQVYPDKPPENMYFDLYHKTFGNCILSNQQYVDGPGYHVMDSFKYDLENDNAVNIMQKIEQQHQQQLIKERKFPEYYTRL